MVGANSSIYAMRLVRSKLRKRDENQSPPPRPAVGATTPAAAVPLPLTMVNNAVTTCQPAANQVTTTTVLPSPEACPGSTATTTIFPPQFLWQYPAPYSLYSNDQDTLVHTLPAEQPGSCRGFRKNLRGRWKRLVKKKAANEVYTIPAELRDQLKQIYVY